MKLTLALFLVVFFSTCRKECCQDPSNPKCENYDPCYGITEANADFTIYEALGDIRYSDTMFTEADTVYGHNSVCFVPKHKNDSFTWILGAEIEKSKTLCRSYFPPDRNITVTLITQCNSPCLNGKKQRDTVTKKFHSKALRKQPAYDTINPLLSPFWGTWKGHHTDKPHEEFMISFGYIENPNRVISCAEPANLAGLPKGLWPQAPFYLDMAEMCNGGDNYIGYKSILRTEIELDGVQGSFALSYKARIFNNRVTINYKYNQTSYQKWLATGNKQPENTPFNLISKTWVGTKISNQIIR
ncbi:MAG: hypothetical protein Q8K70_04890 [Bacteroidota bacterium]|nr:hypothetical protein [Bacteroidota bacterium]